MKVLYVSKAAHTPAHRDKLRWLARTVDLPTVVPREWGGISLPEGAPGDPELMPLPVRLSGHNHLHVYRGLGALIRRIRPDLVHMDEEPSTRPDRWRTNAALRLRRWRAGRVLVAVYRRLPGWMRRILSLRALRRRPR